MQRVLVAVAGFAVLVALLTAGCGGDSDKKANEAYADGVCAAVATWQQQVKTIATDFSAGISKPVLEEKITQVETATKKLVTDIKAVPPPDTAQGQAAKQQLDQFSSDASRTIDAARSAASQLPEDASAGSIAGAVLSIGPQVTNLLDSGKSALSALKDVGGSLSSAFESSASCKSLT